MLSRIAMRDRFPHLAVPAVVGLAIDDECLYFGDVVDGVYSVAKSAWNKLP